MGLCVCVSVCICVSAQVRGCRRPCADSLPASAPTRGISADGCVHTGHVALSPTFRARSPQRVARIPARSHSRLPYCTRTISAAGCAYTGQIALSPAFRALDTHDLRRGLRGNVTTRTLACISRTRHARSPQRVARVCDKSHSRLHFAHSTRTIPAEGCIFG